MISLRNFARRTWMGRLLLVPWRCKAALCATLPPVGRALAWTFTSREHYNFTYELDELNLKHLTAFVATVTGQKYEVVEGYIRELQEDHALREHIVRASRQSAERHVTDAEARFGRRIGWYALIRALKPRVCVETGTDKGLGTCVMAAALIRNAREGSPGKVIGMDLNPDAGYLVQPPYDQCARFVAGDSHASIRALTDEVDFFLHDSDHTPEHEAQEFELIAPKLSARAVVLSDNAEVTDKLLAFARATGREFLFFAEKPARHWCAGSGIGVAFWRQPK
jgi:predicted O-methyltransferase YrrM